jgi:hypothetical protein
VSYNSKRAIGDWCLFIGINFLPYIAMVCLALTSRHLGYQYWWGFFLPALVITADPYPSPWTKAKKYKEEGDWDYGRASK